MNIAARFCHRSVINASSLRSRPLAANPPAGGMVVVRGQSAAGAEE